MKRNTANFANTAAAAAADMLEQPSVLFGNIFSLVNEADKLRWVQISPYGDWPNAQGMQRITKEDALEVDTGRDEKGLIHEITCEGSELKVGLEDNFTDEATRKYLGKLLEELARWTERLSRP